MSRGGRWGLIGLAVVVAAAAFLIARPGDDDDGGGDDRAAQTATRQATGPTATAPVPEPPPDGPDPTVITVTGHSVDEVVDIRVTKGERVRLVVRSDQPDEIHVHGYDLARDAAPGSPARFSFPATIEGIFEIESHEAEHQGVDALIARLVVEPS